MRPDDLVVQSDVFDLDVSLVEREDPASLVNMTNDGCGTTCEKDTCISGA
ncbi:FxLD family lantipeptide [Haloactinospora alba]|uniref:FxLD family lantipeptide n=1 Tax=Haloactinospora alba TaxID=405555 RepID=A0A543NLJ7_9ACTN|nr:FxLD family lanthipeptide [Haloactinospora alba]TQN32684.1 FxLD family lantipeptide [Haloactinospora alba]